MLTMLQLCNLLTSNELYSWFYFPTDYLTSLTKEELDLVSVEIINEPNLVRLWFPKDKHKQTAESLKRQLLLAIEKENWVEVVRVKKLLISL